MIAPPVPPGGASWSGFGLVIRSDIVLPGAVRVADDAPADIEIVQGSSLDWSAADRVAARTWEIYRAASADLFEIALPGIGRFTCVDRRRIVVDPLPDAGATDLAEMIVATVLPALLWARGDVLIHASAFLLAGASRGIAVAGASGGGKSFALGRALAMGARQIADDSVRFRIGEDGARVAGLAGGYFERSGPTRAFRATDASRQAATATLGALIILTPGIAAPRRLAGQEAMAALLLHRHRPRIATLLGMEAGLLPAMAAIPRAVPIVAVPLGHEETGDSAYQDVGPGCND